MANETLTLSGLPPATNWFVFNIEEAGYYRVNYNSENWQLIINQLRTNNAIISSKNRAQLIDDSLLLARSGRLPYSTALELNSYLEFETVYAPWQAGLTDMEYLESMFTGSAGYGAFKVRTIAREDI